MIPDELLIAITFHFVPSRLPYLKRVSNHFQYLSKNTKVFICTNSNDPGDHDLIRKQVALPTEIFVPTYLGHPYLLTWSHLDIFRRKFLSNSTISHFMYLEDDIEVRVPNIQYWIEAK